MNATLVYSISSSVFTTHGFELAVKRELHKIHGEETKKYPEGYRFGWIAFDRSDSTKSVLFDCHPPKGCHYHIDGEQPGHSFEWKGLEEATSFFWIKVWERFGPRMGGEVI